MLDYLVISYLSYTIPYTIPYTILIKLLFWYKLLYT
jgi:hypothetical protein